MLSLQEYAYRAAKKIQINFTSQDVTALFTYLTNNYILSIRENQHDSVLSSELAA